MKELWVDKILAPEHSLGLGWFMSYALVTGGDLWYTFGLSLASIPAGSVMFYGHEWIWDKIK